MLPYVKQFTVEEARLLGRLVPIVLLVAMVSIAAAACGGDSDPEPTAAPQSPAPTSPPAPAPAPTVSAPLPTVPPQTSASTEGTVVEVLNQDLGGSGVYEFLPADFTFAAGETVTFNIVAETEFHTFTVFDLEIDVEIDAGQTELFTFTFDNPGNYELVCTVHELQGMVGTITVQ